MLNDVAYNICGVSYSKAILPASGEEGREASIMPYTSLDLI